MRDSWSFCSARPTQAARRVAATGTTLLELVVALFIISLTVAVSSLAILSLREPAGAQVTRRLAAARDSAIRSGRPVVMVLAPPDTDRLEHHRPHSSHVLFLPDGRVIGAGIDLLTGVPRERQ
jgi:hypothetical protein